MELTIYDVIRGPVLTDKASLLMQKLGKMVLEVHPKANKPMIKQAVEKAFGVKIDSVRVVVRKGKVRTFKRIKSIGKTTKKAIITLKEGYSLNKIAQQASFAQSQSTEVAG